MELSFSKHYFCCFLSIFGVCTLHKSDGASDCPEEVKKETTALRVLKEKFNLVPEHVERRQLENHSHPGEFQVGWNYEKDYCQQYSHNPIPY